MSADGFIFGPLDAGGKYARSRGAFDGVIGFADGLSSAVNSFERVTGGLSNISQDVASGIGAQDKVRLDRAQREQDLFLQKLKVQRGDNRFVYLTVAAAAVAVILIFK